MHSILVVANRTLGGEPLLSLLQERAGHGQCRVHVLVPAGPDPRGWASTNEDDRQAAEQRLQAALRRFSALGCEVTGEVGDSRPLDAVGDVLRARAVDEVVVSTLPPGPSRWLRADLVSRLTRAVDVPVTHVIGSEQPAAL